MPEYLSYYQPDPDQNIPHAPAETLNVHLSPTYRSKMKAGREYPLDIYGSFSARNGQYAWPKEMTGEEVSRYSTNVSGVDGYRDLFDIWPDGDPNLELYESESHMCRPARWIVVPQVQIERGPHVLAVSAFDHDNKLAASRELKIKVKNRQRFV